MILSGLANPKQVWIPLKFKREIFTVMKSVRIIQYLLT